jgi:hypothetical protein
MAEPISSEHLDRIIELISQAEKLIAITDSWISPPSKAAPSSSHEPLSNVSRANGTIVARSKPGKPIDGLVKFKRRILAELGFLKDVRDLKVKFKKEHLSCSNLSHYAAIIDRVVKEGPENVRAICKVFHMKKQDSTVEHLKMGGLKVPRPQRVEVDIVSKNGACWIKVKAMSAGGVSAVVNGTATGSRKSVLEVAKELKQASHYNLVHYHPPELIFHFTRGVSNRVYEALKKNGVQIEGDIVENLEDELLESDSEDDSSSSEESIEEVKNGPDASEEAEVGKEGDRAIRVVNLDVTTLITMVSQVTNGGDEDEFEDALLTQQAEEERTQSTLSSLTDFFEGKDLIVTECAIEKFFGILKIVGGPKEQERARQLLPPSPSSKIRIVPNLSSPLLESLHAPRVKDQHRIIFGTGHALKATTATANVAFTQTAKENGVFLSLFIHPARALTEQKAIPKKADSSDQP